MLIKSGEKTALKFGQQSLKALHILGRCGLETQGLAGHRVDEAEDGGVQGLTGQADLGDGGADQDGGAA